MTDLRDLRDDQLFVQIGGDWGVQDCLTELARRLAELRAELSSKNEQAYWDHFSLLAAEADRDRLREAMMSIMSTAGHPEAAEGCRLIIGVARAALKEEG